MVRPQAIVWNMAVGLIFFTSPTHTEGELEKAAGQSCKSRDSTDVCARSPHAHSQAGKSFTLQTQLGIPNCKVREEGDATFQTQSDTFHVAAETSILCCYVQ